MGQNVDSMMIPDFFIEVRKDDQFIWRKAGTSAIHLRVQLFLVIAMAGLKNWLYS
jgi:hypothetical protein